MTTNEHQQTPDRNAVRDAQVGRNVAQLRGEKSQAAVADEMRKLGWKWSQATVWAVEKGDRPLKLGEARDLLDVLGAPFGGVETVLLRPTAFVRYKQAGHRAHDRWQQLVSAIKDFRQAQLDLAFAYEEVRDDDALTLGDVGYADSWLAEDAIEQAIAEADLQWNTSYDHQDRQAQEGGFEQVFKGSDTRLNINRARRDADEGVGGGEHPAQD